MNKATLSLATAMIASVAGGISLSNFAPQFLSSALAEQNVEAVEVAPTEVLEEAPVVEEIKASIATVSYTHLKLPTTSRV